MVEAEDFLQPPDLGDRALHEALRQAPVRVMDLEEASAPMAAPPGHEAGLGPSGATERHEAQTRRRRSDPDDASAGDKMNHVAASVACRLVAGVVDLRLLPGSETELVVSAPVPST